MLQIDRLSDTPFYIQIYMYFRKEIEAHRMPAGMKLSSVRELAQTIEVSKMTVEKAYYQLASEGYIIRHNRSRYAVAHLDAIKRDAEPVDNQNVTPVPIRYRYDFGSGDMDLNYFPMTEWRKSMNRVLSHPDALLANMDEQGAPALRQALSQYVLDMRGVKARPENIVISSGTVPLLALLASLLQHDYNRIAVEEPGFKLGRELLRTMGYTITPVALEKGEFSLEALEKVRPALSMSARRTNSRQGQSCLLARGTDSSAGPLHRMALSSKTIMTASSVIKDGLCRHCRASIQRTASSTWGLYRRYCRHLFA